MPSSSAARDLRSATGTSPPTMAPMTSTTSGPPTRRARRPAGPGRKTTSGWASERKPSSMRRSASVETATFWRRAASRSRPYTGSSEKRIDTTGMTTL